MGPHHTDSGARAQDSRTAWLSFLTRAAPTPPRLPPRGPWSVRHAMPEPSSAGSGRTSRRGGDCSPASRYLFTAAVSVHATRKHTHTCPNQSAHAVPGLQSHRLGGPAAEREPTGGRRDLHPPPARGRASPTVRRPPERPPARRARGSRSVWWWPVRRDASR